MSSRGETVSKPTSTTELSSSATPKNTDTDARPSSASPSASVSPSPSLETESHEPTKDVNGDHSSTSKVSSASALASESASSNHSDTSADQPDSTKSVSGKVSATTKPASSTIFRSTITPAATLPRNPAGSKTFSISSSSKHTSASHHETDLYSSTRSTGTHTHTMSHAPPHRSSYASGSHVSSSSRVSRSHASSSHASSSRAVISHISAHVPQGTNSLHLSNASPSSHTTVISSVSGSKVNSHHGSKTSSHVSSATSAPSHSMQSSSHSKPTPPQTTNELTTTTTTTTTTATTTTTTSDAVETTSEPTTSITQTKSHSPSPYHYQTYSWLSNTFSIALSTTTSKPTSSQSSYKASETLHPSSSPSDTDTTDDNLPQYIAPNINAEIPDTSDLVNMKFNYLSYPQMVQDALLTAEFVQALPVLISKVLDISEDDVIIVTITSGSQQSGKKKRQTTDSTGVIVSMAIPSTEVTELQTLVASSDSSLYAASNGQLASLIDSSYKITSSSVASTANTPVVSDPNSGSVESSEASSQPDQQKSGLSKGSIIGICVSVGAIVYAAATVIVVKKIRHRKRQIQEPPMVDQHVFARSISAPISQGNSLGWSNNRSPPEPLPHPSYYQQW
ncbi:hypothetical protein J3Q64DRAFT_1420479 [Phycomyces blakesleeanus]|uniref:Mid2 domain-containing protein n=1 Tax=Phycomyces blakesleeanus TaxID=4837 RepID=A0ABR3AH12_PHYBL